MGYEKISQKLTFYKAFFSPQWKFLIHIVLQCLSSKTTTWNMASAIIYLATNRKFNFSKYIFESMVRNLENVSSKFLMYPRFVQVFLDKQLDGMSTHNGIYDAPSHTKKIFGNMRRVGKGFSGRVTPLFPKMVVQNQAKLGGGPGCQDTMGDTIAQTRFANVSKLSNDLLLARGNILQSDDDRLKLNELMELCTNLQKKVLDLEKTNTTQANEIASLKGRVKKLEQKKRSRTHGLKRLYKVGLTARVESSGDEEDLGEDASKQGRRINAIDVDEDITVVNDDAHKEMFGVDTLNVSSATTIVTITTEEITLAQALADLKSTKPKAKGIAFREPGESTTTIFSQHMQDKGLSQDKGKGILVELEKPLMKRK
ncbi:hypothetical protein Tco_1250363 [Tanacetum coccineum]